MPLTVRIQTENGQVLKQFFDVQDVMVTVAQRLGPPQLQIAHTVDPYGDTYFNYLQIPLLLQDIDRLMNSGISSQEAETLAGIMEIAQQALLERHLYLRFVGD